MNTQDFLSKVDDSGPLTLGKVVERIYVDLHSVAMLIQGVSVLAGMALIVVGFLELKAAYTFDKQGHAAGETGKGIALIFVGSAMIAITITCTTIGQTLFGIDAQVFK